MNAWQPFRWNEINVLFHLRNHWLSVLLEWNEFPCMYFSLQLRPKLQYFRTTASFSVDYLTFR